MARSLLLPPTRPQRRQRRDPHVAANGRLTATTGVVLLVLLFLEGITILRIVPLFSWHVWIGLALIPVVGLKLLSTTYRFARYYLGDPRFRAAGPPVPLLRLAGPLVALSTMAVLATGVAAWLAGPSAFGILFLHKAVFVVWFGLMSIHVLAHARRAIRWTRADLPSGPSSRALRGAAGRQAVVLGSLAAGIAVAVLAGHLGAIGWGAWMHVHG